MNAISLMKTTLFRWTACPHLTQKTQCFIHERIRSLACMLEAYVCLPEGKHSQISADKFSIWNQKPGNKTGQSEQKGSGRPSQEDLHKRWFSKSFLERARRGWKLGTNSRVGCSKPRDWHAKSPGDHSSKSELTSLSGCPNYTATKHHE